jgi:hypothetical protein
MLRALGWVVLGIIAIPIACFGSAFVYETWHTYTYRYRLTIEVEADGNVHVGSGVRQASLTRKATWIPQTGGAYSGVRGEAIAIDLGKRGMLFALLKGVTFKGDAERIVIEAFSAPPHLMPASAANMQRYKDTVLKSELAPNQYPLFVRFRDLNDPMTVELFDDTMSPRLSPDDPRLLRVTIETTRDAVTSGLSKTLVWFDEWQKRGGTFSGQIIFNGSTPPEALLIPSDFAR